MSSDILSIDEREVVERLCRGSLAHFVQEGWSAIEPETPLVWNWHMQVICDHLQAMLEGPKRKGPWQQNLIINVPPGTSKSRLTSVFAPAWQWLRRPSWRALYVSATPTVALRDSMKCKDLIESEWFQGTFQPKWKLSADQNAKSNYENTRGGARIAKSVGAGVTGDRVEAIFVDDPIDAADANSNPIRESVNQWYSSALNNRVATPATATRIIIMQRLHEEDLSGYLLNPENATGWDHLCIPMEAEEPKKPTFLGWVDRRKPGELLMPSRFDAKYLAGEKVSLGSTGYAGQMQQRPAPVGGNKFKREWWQYWHDPTWPTWKILSKRPKDASDKPTVALPPEGRRGFDAIFQSWDMSFKGGDKNDWTVGLTVGIAGSRRYVLEMVRRKMGFSEAQREVRAMYERWRPMGILIEEAANGHAVIQTLTDKIPGIIPVRPEGGKESRAAGMEPKVEAGNWLLPADALWLDIWVDEFGSFPKGKHDDVCDSASQVETYLTSTGFEAARALCAF